MNQRPPIDVLGRAVRRLCHNSMAAYEAWLKAAADGNAPGTSKIEFEADDDVRPGGYCDLPGRGY
jgi:hypothetical protein